MVSVISQLIMVQDLPVTAKLSTKSGLTKLCNLLEKRLAVVVCWVSIICLSDTPLLLSRVGVLDTYAGVNLIG